MKKRVFESLKRALSFVLAVTILSSTCVVGLAESIQGNSENAAYGLVQTESNNAPNSEVTPEETPAPKPEETPAPTPEETPAPKPEETPAPTPEETPAPDQSDSASEEEEDLSGLAQFGWQVLNGYTYYQYSDGSYAKGLVMIDGALYVFDVAGRMRTGHINEGGEWYYSGANGRLQGNFLLDRGNGDYTFYEEYGRARTGWQQNVATGERYYQVLDQNKSMLLVIKGRATIDNKAYWFANTGALRTGWITEEGGTYYADLSTGALVTGSQMIDGGLYIFDANGKLRTGHIYENGEWYYSGENGKLLGNYLLDRGNGDFTFYEEYGRARIGWQRNVATGDRYYQMFNKERSLLLIARGRTTIDGSDYWFTDAGALRTGWLAEAEGTYYADPTSGKLAQGKVAMNGGLYLFDETGKLRTGHIYTDGDWYYGKEDGKLVGNYLLSRGGGDYTFYEEYGRARVGFQRNVVTGERYYQYIDSNRGMMLLARGTKLINGLPYIFSENCVLQSGWFDYNGRRYYNNPNTAQTVTGYQTIGNNKYIFDQQGRLQAGSIYYNERWYRADNNGVLLCDEFFDHGDGNKTYYNSIGEAKLGWAVRANGDRYYQILNGTYQIVKGKYAVDGQLYYFGTEGKLFCPPQASWHVVEGQRYYILTDGRICLAPVINQVDATYQSESNSYIITVKATMNATGANPAGAYSIDGGVTWQASNTFVVPATPNGKIHAGYICARDNAVPPQMDVYKSEISTATHTSTGIDVSAHQGIIDWKQVANSGVEFAVIRGLTWSRSAGYYVIDPYFEQNVRNAKANGIKVGAYLYSYAYNKSEMATEVNFFVYSPEMTRLRNEGILLDLPIYIDYEDPLILKNTSSNDQRTDIVRYGMQLLNQINYKTGFYTYENFARQSMNAQQLINEGYDFWIANFNGSQGFGPQVEMWQYTSTGRVPGISGNVDLNISYKQFPAAGGTIPGEVQSTLTVFDLNTKTVVTAPAERILAEIVQNEVGGGLGLTGADAKTLYRAQAVAAHSWLQYQYNNGITTPQVGLQATVNTLITSAVAEVKQYLVVYEGSAALTTYGSASGTKTNAAPNMGWKALPYLNSVDSAYESWEGGAVWQGRRNTISMERMRTNIEKMLGADATREYSTTNWLSNPVYDANGYLIRITVCGKVVNGGKFYEDCYGLYSPKFVIENNGNGGKWTFLTYGNGHCVGMSQYGAAGYIAKNPWDWKQVLSHYYPGTEIYG